MNLWFCLYLVIVIPLAWWYVHVRRPLPIEWRPELWESAWTCNACGGVKLEDVEILARAGGRPFCRLCGEFDRLRLCTAKPKFRRLEGTFGSYDPNGDVVSAGWEVKLPETSFVTPNASYVSKDEAIAYAASRVSCRERFARLARFGPGIPTTTPQVRKKPFVVVSTCCGSETYIKDGGYVCHKCDHYFGVEQCPESLLPDSECRCPACYWGDKVISKCCSAEVVSASVVGHSPRDIRETQVCETCRKEVVS